jgi:hypothetical protein
VGQEIATRKVCLLSLSGTLSASEASVEGVDDMEVSVGGGWDNDNVGSATTFELRTLNFEL